MTVPKFDDELDDQLEPSRCKVCLTCRKPSIVRIPGLRRDRDGHYTGLETEWRGIFKEKERGCSWDITLPGPGIYKGVDGEGPFWLVVKTAGQRRVEGWAWDYGIKDYVRDINLRLVPNKQLETEHDGWAHLWEWLNSLAPKPSYDSRSTNGPSRHQAYLNKILDLESL